MSVDTASADTATTPPTRFDDIPPLSRLVPLRAVQGPSSVERP